MVRAALYQGPAQPGSIASNLNAIGRAARSAAAAGADILVTPELSSTGYNVGQRMIEFAQPSTGETCRRVCEMARGYGIAIVCGYPESDAGAVYNSTMVVGADGHSLAHYRKTHLYGDYERSVFAPGQDLVTQFDFKGVRCGVITCYDVEFPETVRAHADAGTQWLLVPTGLMRPFEHVALHIVPARAYESQVFITYVNRCGSEHGLEFCGLSCAIAPDGGEMVRAGAHEDLLIADIDTTVLDRSRAVNTHLSDRRRDLY